MTNKFKRTAKITLSFKGAKEAVYECKEYLEDRCDIKCFLGKTSEKNIECITEESPELHQVSEGVEYHSENLHDKKWQNAIEFLKEHKKDVKVSFSVIYIEKISGFTLNNLDNLLG